ncbi:benzoate/H(+) symporter BenE family transporter [Fredinandcohnia sp. QZ13]|uniref:benzoate/H(+) symporter BenE family transporter n=1 Tax=Fredinandcohnia sp. QZ13 TaxID=3073144 RepID=UPI00285326B1|nr:benzoate/H(+) symporter BenE family transporter [Fredinandcohnia sp. QZ13]MDR4887669.1 benzoate/H(+) symporter BenE family transporter [Fredinandcohnia sp. QZ13]
MKDNSRFKDLNENLTINTVSSGIVAAIFGCTGPALIIIGGASSGGLTHEQTISWLFAVYFFGGLLGLFLSMKYKQPIAGAYSIAGAVLVAAALSHFSLPEAIGAYLVANLMVLILGVSGLIDKVMNWIPVPIVMGMIVGVMMRFAIEMIASVEVSPLLAGSAIIVYLFSSRFIKKVPPVLSALVVSVLLALVINEFNFSNVQSSFVLPQLEMPAFSVNAIMSLSIPLAILIICTENAQTTGILMAKGFKPPSSAMAVFGSIFGFFASFFGAHAVNTAGPMTAICASDESGKKEGRYAASALNGVLFASFGVFAAYVVPIVIAMPAVIVSTIAGLAMIGVLLSSLKIAFSDSKFQMGAFFAFIIGMSGVNFFNIGAPLWAIVGSILVSLLIERHDFEKKIKTEQNLKPGV